MLPGEPDAAMELERLTAEVGERVIDVGARRGHGLGGVRKAVAEGQGGVVGGSPHALELDEQIGQAVLDGLETSDGPAECTRFLA